MFGLDFITWNWIVTVVGIGSSAALASALIKSRLFGSYNKKFIGLFIPALLVGGALSYVSENFLGTYPANVFKVLCINITVYSVGHLIILIDNVI